MKAQSYRASRKVSRRACAAFARLKGIKVCRTLNGYDPPEVQLEYSGYVGRLNLNRLPIALERYA